MKNGIEVIAIVGPTASGKTGLSIELAKLVDGEIINGDALQVYKGLNVGTAKITKEEMDGIPHHLFDIKEPTESFSVAEYQTAVRNCIQLIQQRGKLPIIVGGTGLYVQSVLYDFRFTEEASDLAVRHRLEQELANEGAEQLYARLVKADPIGAEKIHPNNYRRIVRALEIIEVTGKTKSSHEQQVGNKPLFNHLLIGLEWNREVLYTRINKRVDQMMANGFLQEAQDLWDNGIRNMQSVQAIGYKELHSAIEGEISVEEAVELIKKNTRNYAKRQMTYFKNKLSITWLDGKKDNSEMIDEILRKMKDL